MTNPTQPNPNREVESGATGGTMNCNHRENMSHCTECCEEEHAEVFKHVKQLQSELSALKGENLQLLDDNAQQAGRLLELAGKHPKVSVDVGGVRVLGIQGPNQFSLEVMNASLVDHIRELQSELAEAKGRYSAMERAEATAHEQIYQLQKERDALKGENERLMRVLEAHL